MKPFTIRKAAGPSRGGYATAGAAAGDASADASMHKYNSSGPVGSSVNFGPLGSSMDEGAQQPADVDETLLEQADLDRLKEEFPGKTPENPWIKE